MEEYDADKVVMTKKLHNDNDIDNDGDRDVTFMVRV